MKKRIGNSTGRILSRAMLMMVCAVLSATAAFGQVLKRSKPVTNEDVLQMARQGASESAIIAKIGANPTKFELTVDKILALHRQGVSTHILNAMVIAELRQRKAGGEKNADELSPQPYPPKGALLNPGGQQTMLGTQANSPAGDGTKSALIPAVQRPAVTDGTMGDGSARPGASAVPAVQTGTLNGSGKTAITDGTKTAVTAPTMMQNTSPGPVGASQPMSATVGTSPSAGLLARTQTAPPLMSSATTPAPQQRPAGSQPRSASGVGTAAAAELMPSKINLQVAAECAKDPTERILGVTASPSLPANVVTIAPDHQYTIWGCSLGQANPSNTVLFLWGGGGYVNGYAGVAVFAVALDVSSWSPNAIIASVSVDTAMVSAVEESYGTVQLTNGTLLVAPNGIGKAQASLSGVAFRVVS
jgi:hypothetical protein